MMTNDEFRAWRERHFDSRHAAALATGLNRDTIEALESGRTRNGTDYPVRPYIELMCRAVDAGLSEFGDRENRRIVLSSTLKLAAELIEKGEI